MTMIRVRKIGLIRKWKVKNSSTMLWFSAIAIASVLAFQFTGRDFAFAQNPDQTQGANQSDRIAAAIKSKLTTFLARHLESNRFNISVGVTLGQQSEDSSIPYLPRGLTKAAFSSQSLQQLISATSRISVQLSLADDLSKPEVQSIQSLISSEANLRQQRGDRLNIIRFTAPKPQKIESDSDRNSQERDNQQTENINSGPDPELTRSLSEVSQLTNEVAALNRERSDVMQRLQTKEQELASLKNKQEDIIRENQTQEEQLKEKNRSLSILEAERQSVSNRILTFGGILLAIFCLALILVTLVLGKSFEKIGASIQSVGNSVREGLLNTNTNKSEELTEDTDSFKATQTDPVESSNVNEQYSIPSEEVRQSLLSLNKELTENFNEDAHYVLFSFCNHVLSSRTEVAKIVVLLEFFGPDISNPIYNKLSPKKQEFVLQFLKEPNYPKQKWIFMLEQVETFKTMMLRPGFGMAEFVPNQEVRLKLEEVDNEFLKKLTFNIAENDLGRLWLYLDAPSISEIFESLYKEDTEKWKICIKTFSSIYDFEKRESADSTILKAINRLQEEQKSDIKKVWLPYYKRVIETISSDLAEATIEQVRINDPVIAENIRAIVVIYRDFFMLNSNFKQEIISKLRNRHVAALMAQSSVQEGSIIKDLLNSQRLSVIEEEVELLASMSNNRRLKAIQEMKEALVGHIKELIKEEGEMSILCEPIPGEANNSSTADKEVA